ncbi:hypothetical protein NE237_031887 [Protea cynaroides]|uniref:mRNA (guanine-N(7))-methyltransferase n=1 Tax=Protea cynaroides TaxID=273540 RepID=A0A9Q0L2D5_9MAGN|nr:hypothetical protein NE237_031887 [Protea cynaroides]
MMIRYNWGKFWKMMHHLIYAAVSLLCTTRGGIFIGTMPDANVIIKKLREVEGLAFGNSVYGIHFDEEYAQKKFKSSSPFGIKYKFHLEDAVDCLERIVPFHVFKSLAEEPLPTREGCFLFFLKFREDKEIAIDASPSTSIG